LEQELLIHPGQMSSLPFIYVLAGDGVVDVKLHVNVLTFSVPCCEMYS
jgi:hypothetical protein